MSAGKFASSGGNSVVTSPFRNNYAKYSGNIYCNSTSVGISTGSNN
jgi:hypothetical protein